MSYRVPVATLTSADGTTITYDRLGDGPPLIIVPGAMCTRGITAPVAALLAERCTVFNVDRRARGDSDDQSGAPYATEREIEDLAALIDAAGGHAALYGHSSGAAVALRATAAGLPVDRLIIHDAPYQLDPDDAERTYHETLQQVLADGDPGAAVVAFFTRVGMPAEVIDGMKSGPGWSSMAGAGYSLAYDSAAMGDPAGGGVPHDLLSRVAVPTLVLAGGATYPFMIDSAKALHAGIEGSTYAELPGAGHDATAEQIAPPVLEFLTGQ